MNFISTTSVRMQQQQLNAAQSQGFLRQQLYAELMDELKSVGKQVLAHKSRYSVHPNSTIGGMMLDLLDGYDPDECWD